MWVCVPLEEYTALPCELGIDFGGAGVVCFRLQLAVGPSAVGRGSSPCASPTCPPTSTPRPHSPRAPPRASASGSRQRHGESDHIARLGVGRNLERDWALGALSFEGLAWSRALWDLQSQLRAPAAAVAPAANSGPGRRTSARTPRRPSGQC